jgi:hypothetical protein
MRSPLPSILAVVLASGTVYAQPAERDHRRPPPPPPVVERDHRGPGVGLGVVINATVAPPAPVVENPGTKAGFVWIPGRHDWKNGKWEWMAGHWERERAGKHWRPGRWEARGGGWAWTEGEWAEGAAEVAAATPPPPPPGAAVAPPPPPPGGPGPVVRDHREWKFDRPIVSSYWPAKGKPGRKVVIKGENFPPEAMVVFAGAEIKAAKVTPTEIVFDVPPGAASGEIVLKRPHGRDLPVGMFEVAAGYDPEAEAKKMDEERRKAAEAAWKDRQKSWAKDRAAREAAWHAHWTEMEGNREARREKREQEIRAKWDAAFLADADTQAELALHAQRIAQLTQAASIAEVNANEKLGVRIQVATQRENDRHEQRMAALKAGFGAKAGAP